MFVLSKLNMYNIFSDYLAYHFLLEPNQGMRWPFYLLNLLGWLINNVDYGTLIMS